MGEPPMPMPVWIHLHGDHRVVQTNYLQCGESGVLATLTLPGLSSVYTRHFSDAAVWPDLLKEIHKTLRHHFGQEVSLGRITLSSFSAGYGGIREILRQTDGEGIDRILLADSLYAGFTGNPADRRIEPSHLAPFLDFARQAAAGKKQMTVTHTQLATPNYASTWETAAALLEAVGGVPTVEDGNQGKELPRISHFKRKGLAIYGYAGKTGEAHMAHLRQIHLFMREWHSDP